MPNEKSKAILLWFRPAISCNIFVAKLVIQIKYTERTSWKFNITLFSAAIKCEIVSFLPKKLDVPCPVIWLSVITV